MRSFASCVRNAYWHCFRRFHNPTFFISAARDEQAESAYFLREFYPESQVVVEIVDQPTLIEPDFDLVRHAPYAPASSSDPKTVVQSILRQLWHRERVYEFAWAHTKDQFAFEFDVVVRHRADILFQSFELPTRCRQNLLGRDMIFTPWKARCGGVNDRFAIMGTAAADAYFTLWSKLGGYLADGCPLHPESLLLYALEEAGAEIHQTLLTEFTTIRLPGTGPDVQLIEYPGELASFIAATVRRNHDA